MLPTTCISVSVVWAINWISGIMISDESLAEINSQRVKGIKKSELSCKTRTACTTDVKKMWRLEGNLCQDYILNNGS